jgi:hypothetical protein
MARIDDGGPAFPVEIQVSKMSDGSLKAERVGTPGMSLRDWFAGQALALIDGNLSRREANLSHEAIGKEAYAIADAMLAARKAAQP